MPEPQRADTQIVIAMGRSCEEKQFKNRHGKKHGLLCRRAGKRRTAEKGKRTVAAGADAGLRSHAVRLVGVLHATA